MAVHLCQLESRGTAQKPASELIGRCVWDEFPEAVKTPFFSELHRAMREQIPVEFDNYLSLWTDGLRIRLSESFRCRSVLPRYYGRVRTHRALERKTAELARKNSELEMFAYVASHDLQEPLRMIGSYAALLAKRYSGLIDREADEFIEFIVGGVDRMQRLIKGLLALCRLEQAESASWSVVDAGTFMDLVCGNLDLLIEDTGATIVRGELPVIKFEETQFLQLMQNLIGNALKYRREAPRITVGARREGSGWTFSVSDNGIGFDSSSCGAGLHAIQTAPERRRWRKRHRFGHLQENCREPGRPDLGGVGSRSRFHFFLHHSGRACLLANRACGSEPRFRRHDRLPRQHSFPANFPLDTPCPRK